VTASISFTDGVELTKDSVETCIIEAVTFFGAESSLVTASISFTDSMELIKDSVETTFHTVKLTWDSVKLTKDSVETTFHTVKLTSDGVKFKPHILNVKINYTLNLAIN
jgi:hypothetical protein